ncbi:hypothetical protein GGR52DRAFT_119207 [Hypoxylon sp. FL1284]|nr:hypothetical protein GGR52DRAFT_119207 [Hypoxylon sp. FL1284]
MADAENFEDDLFADLYDDNEPTAAPAPAASAPQAAAIPTQPEPQSIEAPGQLELDQAAANVAPVAPAAEENGAYDDTYQEDAYDDDDDVDFNLGNDQSSVTATAIAAAQSQHDESTPTFHGARAPGAKEDG